MKVSSLIKIVRVLNENMVKYLIVGGLAVNAHGFARFTLDVDLVIGLEPENIVLGLKALESIGYKPSIPVTPEEFADSHNRDAWRRDKGMLVLKLWSDEHRRTPVDIFVYEPFPFEQEFRLAKWDQVAEAVQAPFIRYEQLLQMKMDAGREKDLLDISALRKIHS